MVLIYGTLILLGISLVSALLASVFIIFATDAAEDRETATRNIVMLSNILMVTFFLITSVTLSYLGY